MKELSEVVAEFPDLIGPKPGTDEKYPIVLEINYIITIPDGDPHKASPMQGFAPSLCRNAWMVRAATVLPSTIYDLTPGGHDTLLPRRIAGSNPINWFGQSPRAIRSFKVPPFTPFTVVMIGQEDSAADYHPWAQACVVPPVLIAEKGGDLKFTELTPDALRLAFLRRCDLLPSYIHPDAVGNAKEMLSSWVPGRELNLGYRVGGHNSVTPNVAVLHSAGYVDFESGPFERINEGPKPYVEQIAQTSRSILEHREKVGERDIQRIFRPTLDLNLFAPAIYPHFLNMPLPQNWERQRRREFMLVRQALEKQSGYAFDTSNAEQMNAVMGIGPKAEKGAKPQPHPLLLVRRRELDLGTDAVAALATSEFSAVIRLPNDVNRSAGLVRTFAEQYRGHKQDSMKRVFAFREIQKRLGEAVDPAFIDLIRESKTGIRILADAHLEWLDIDGIPLGLRKNVTRIPATPGNLFVNEVGPKERLLLTPKDLRKVLVISALEASDPIKGMFEIAFEEFAKVWKDKLSVTTVQVSTEQEFVDAIDAFDGQLMLFDGHGAHKDDGPAVLYLEDTPVDVWSLQSRIKRMPPIVILSACDTHAADRNHATVANGFIALGARTVLASVFPLLAPTAATFAARLLYRVADFLDPAIKLFDRALTWHEVVSGMLRMQLMTDFLRRLEDIKLITSEGYMDIHKTGNLAINSNAADPFAVVIDSLENAGVDRATALKELEFVIANSSAISYLQIGRPETIIIDDAERASAQLKKIDEAQVAQLIKAPPDATDAMSKS